MEEPVEYITIHLIEDCLGRIHADVSKSDVAIVYFPRVVVRKADDIGKCLQLSLPVSVWLLPTICEQNNLTYRTTQIPFYPNHLFKILE